MKLEDWTIRRILSEYVDAINQSEDREYVARTKNIYTQMIQLLFRKQPVCGELMTVEHFALECECGSFNNYDGFGYYLDWDGNEIGTVNCDMANCWPKKAMFVDWYNK